MEQGGGGEELVELAEAGARAGYDIGASDVLHASQKVGNGLLGGVCRGAIDNFVGVFHSEADDVAVLQFAAFHFLAVDEKTAALAAIFNVVLVGFDDDGAAAARNAPIR